MGILDGDPIYYQELKPILLLDLRGVHDRGATARVRRMQFLECSLSSIVVRGHGWKNIAADQIAFTSSICKPCSCFDRVSYAGSYYYSSNLC